MPWDNPSLKEPPKFLDSIVLSNFLFLSIQKLNIIYLLFIYNLDKNLKRENLLVNN